MKPAPRWRSWMRAACRRAEGGGRTRAAELALRSLRVGEARMALARAHAAAERAQVPALMAEVAEARAALDRPAARRLTAGGEQALRLDEVAALLASDALVVDACRRGLGAGGSGGRWRAGLCCSRWPAHWPRRGPVMPTASPDRVRVPHHAS
jgi:hypothetical protein